MRDGVLPLFVLDPALLEPAGDPRKDYLCDALRSLYRPWTQTIRRSKNGLLLRPNIDLDGELAGVTLPRRSPVPFVAGRGYLAQTGELDIVQVAAARGDG